MSKIKSGDGDEISASSNGTYVVIEIEGEENASIWLTPEQADEHTRQVAAARVELSNVRPHA